MTRAGTLPRTCRSAARSDGVEWRPSSIPAISQVGANDGDTANSAARNRASSGRGLREKEQHKTQATKLGGGLAATEIGYVEAHGTGTPLGDPIEIDALRAALGDPRPNDAKCLIGAVKTNIGHLEAAAGMAGLIKVTMMFNRSIIPRNCNFRIQNPRIDLTDSALELATRQTIWPRTSQPRRAGISSFGMSGTNAHLVVEMPVEKPDRSVA